MTKRFTINKGDYIDSREFTRGECEQFCELAVECGFKISDSVDELESRYWALGVHKEFENTYAYVPDEAELTNNITTQFREFLDKEKGMKQVKDLTSFTKDDLKDGVSVNLRKGDKLYVIEDGLIEPALTYTFSLNAWNSDLTYKYKDNKLDIIRVIDRDGTVLFEREETKKMTVSEAEEELEKVLGYSVEIVE